ncbi:hypothetical protein WN943_016104 [Citrus x changshan-huyou]
MGLVVNECERKGTLKKARCPNCKRWFCFRCKSNWHAGYTCEEIGDLIGDRNDILFGRLVKNFNKYDIFGLNMPPNVTCDIYMVVYRGYRQKVPCCSPLRMKASH